MDIQYVFIHMFSLFVELKYVVCHLKDLGEVETNWTKVLDALENRIVGGEPADLKKYPYNVQFFNKGGLCSGSILTSKTVLTAAHCFDHNHNIAEMTVFSRARFIFDQRARSHEVWEYKIHEKYNNTVVFSNDIAIILIHDQFQFDESVKRAIICDNDIWMNEKETFEATGWGELQYKGETSNRGLMRTNLRYVSRKSCMKSNDVFISPDMFCLYGDGERDTCRGDSGGGILWNNVIVGIVSHGRSCATAPSMYTNVYHFRKWIRSAAWSLNQKKNDTRLSEIGSKIVNGDPIDITAIPSAAQFFNFGSMCAGTIMTSWSVLTAAHCFDNNKETSDMLIQVGARFAYDKDSEAFQVSEFVVHQNYSKAMPFACDIAIIFVSENLKFGPKVKKAVIAYNGDWMNKSEKKFIVAGWGQTKYDGPLSDRGLMMTHLQFVPRKECGQMHHLNLSEDMFCLYGDGIRDSCKGDSGAGVLWKEMVVGIVSHGDGCSRKNKPSIYSNVWYFRKWIEYQLKKYMSTRCAVQ